MIGDKQELDEKAIDTKNYETKEDNLEALNDIINKYLLLKKMKIDPSKPSDNAVVLIRNTLYYDKDFHKFALGNYDGVFLSYDEKTDKFFIGK